MSSRVAVIGAGVAGLTAAHRLSSEGIACDVYERWPGLGGQAATFDAGGGLLLERYYHHLFTTDRHIQALYAQLGMLDGIEWLPSSVAMFAEGEAHPFTTPLDLLRFRPLRPSARLRMGLSVLRLQRRGGGVEPYERETARSWIERSMGREPWEKVWGPLLRGKFGDRAEDISMAWLWSKLTLRRRLEGREARQELLGYPRGSFEPLFAALAAGIEELGGRVMIDRPAAWIDHDPAGPAHGFTVRAGARGSFRAGHDPRSFEPEGEPERYEAVLATVPNDVFERLLSRDLAAAVGDAYLERLRGIEYHAALCLVLELDRRFSRFYWTNVADRTIPFVGLIEQSNLISYGGRHFLYVANYLEQGHPLLERGPDALIEFYEPGLRAVNPEFRRSWIRDRRLFREPAAQPVVTAGYRERIPPLETGVPRLVLANTTQIYPEDRGTNYSVRLGEEAAGRVQAAL